MQHHLTQRHVDSNVWIGARHKEQPINSDHMNL